ncbi:MAG: CvpA family protein [Oscillospiraceae bacterium]|nr:CvpA family protein [Oscillospiraceae bacterium]
MNIKFSGSDAQGFHFNFGGTGNAGEPFGAQQQPQQPRKPRKGVARKGKRIAINLIVTLLVGAGYFYINLPAINPQAEEFYGFVFLLCAVYCVCAMITSGFQGEGTKGYLQFVKKQCTIPFFVVVLMAVAIIVGTVTSWEVLRAGSYQKLLTVGQGNFAEEIAEASYDRIPMLDKASAEKLGDRKLGELADMVSQFEVAENYTQINYHGRPVRVTPLRYGDLIKWFTNRTEGLPAYLIIDMVDQSVDVVRLEEGIKYTTAEHFSRNLYRYLRFNYPTFMFEEPVFEIDEEGTPYWICAKKEKTIGLFGGVDNHGAVLVNAVTGESEYHENPPSWVDHVYDAELIIQQYNYYGMYKNGFINSLFGQRDVTVTTEGYAYLAEGDDVYLYTGVTSVGGDESNIGFLLSNQRTKETKYYPCAGAEEYSAMNSARGQVQHLGYTATFPLLINIAEQPTYFMALKDAAGLVKMYAMVNVNQYQIVATAQTVAACESSYREMLVQSNIIDEDKGNIEEPAPEFEMEEKIGTIDEIRSAVINGNTYYYISLEGEDFIGWRVSAADDPSAPLMDVGDTVGLSYIPGNANLDWTERYSWKEVYALDLLPDNR